MWGERERGLFILPLAIASTQLRHEIKSHLSNEMPYLYFESLFNLEIFVCGTLFTTLNIELFNFCTYIQQTSFRKIVIPLITLIIYFWNCSTRWNRRGLDNTISELYRESFAFGRNDILHISIIQKIKEYLSHI